MMGTKEHLRTSSKSLYYGLSLSSMLLFLSACVGGGTLGTSRNIVNREPDFSAALKDVEIGENTLLVGTFTATDTDAGDTVMYSLTGADAAIFTVDDTGELNFITAPDFEIAGDSGGNNIYNVIIVATDGTNTTEHVLAVNVMDVMEGVAGVAPVFAADVMATVDVAENTTAVGTFTATDTDAGDTVMYSLTGADAAIFTVDDTGELNFITAPDFEIAGDSGGNNIYNVIIVATDGTNTTEHVLAVNVVENNPEKSQETSQETTVSLLIDKALVPTGFDSKSVTLDFSYFVNDGSGIEGSLSRLIKLDTGATGVDPEVGAGDNPEKLPDATAGEYFVLYAIEGTRLYKGAPPTVPTDNLDGEGNLILSITVAGSLDNTHFNVKINGKGVASGTIRVSASSDVEVEDIGDLSVQDDELLIGLSETDYAYHDFG